MNSKTQSRRGAAVVEMAICLPFVFLLIAGAIELSAGLHQQLAVRATVHECATLAAAGPTTTPEVQSTAQSIMSQRGFGDFMITLDEVTRTVNIGTVDPAPITHFDVPSSGFTTPGLEDVPRGTIYRLRLTCARPQTAGIGLFARYLDSQIAADCVFVKEK